MGTKSRLTHIADSENCASEMIMLCNVATLKSQHCLGFDPFATGKDTLFAIYRDNDVFVYQNRCPHEPVPLEYRRHHFMTKDRSQIMCFVHGARFEVDTGNCIHGPCLGEPLQKIAYQIINGAIYCKAEDIDFASASDSSPSIER
jgi:nitrite reductase/ring-hydroxylating ferredoxin subunit